MSAKRGGARPGAGRPKRPGRSKSRTFSATDAQYATMRANWQAECPSGKPSWAAWVRKRCGA